MNINLCKEILVPEILIKEGHLGWQRAFLWKDMSPMLSLHVLVAVSRANPYWQNLGGLTGGGR